MTAKVKLVLSCGKHLYLLMTAKVKLVLSCGKQFWNTVWKKKEWESSTPSKNCQKVKSYGKDWL